MSSETRKNAPASTEKPAEKKKLKFPSTGGPINIYIDTSVFRNLNLNLNHHAFLTIEKSIKSKDLVLLTNSILEGELAARAAEQIKDEDEKLGKFGVLTTLRPDQITQLRSELAITTPGSFLEVLKARFVPKTIDRAVDWKIIFSKHFAIQPPFSAKKPNEFSDAFVIEMLGENLQPCLAVISTDSDYEHFANSKPNVFHYKTLPEFTDQLLKAKTEYQFIQLAEAALKHLEPQIIKDLSEQYSDGGWYDVECYHSEIEAAEVTQLTLRNTELMEIDEAEPSAVFKLHFRGEVELDITSSVVAWDSVDKEEVHLGTNSNSGKIEIEIRTTLKVYIDADDPTSSDYEIEDDEYSAEDFQVPDEWTSFLDDRYEE